MPILLPPLEIMLFCATKKRKEAEVYETPLTCSKHVFTLLGGIKYVVMIILPL